MIESVVIEPLKIKTAVAVGYFDGVHLGHRMILDAAVSYAEQMDLHPAVFTFSMDGTRASGKGSRDLVTVQTKKKRIEELGIEYYVSPPFESFCGLSGKEFVDQVLSRKCLNAAVVVCGDDFRFGKDRKCGVRELARYCGPYGIQVFAQDALVADGERVSSSRIKAALEEGDIRKVNELLGYTYSVTGKVVRGNGRGRELGFPTANIMFPGGCVLPRKGVYISEIDAGGAVYRGITNIGTRPTLTEDCDAVVESHIIGYSGDLYDTEITVRLLEFVRPEQKFGSERELTDAVMLDIKAAEEFGAGEQDAWSAR